MFRLPRTFAVIVGTITLQNLLLSHPVTISYPFLDTAPASRRLTMVVRHACMGLLWRSINYVRSRACNQSLRGIGTVGLPNRPADNEAGGSGAAAAWVPSDKVWPRAGLQVCISYKNSHYIILNSQKILINSLYFSRFSIILHDILET